MMAAFPLPLAMVNPWHSTPLTAPVVSVAQARIRAMILHPTTPTTTPHRTTLVTTRRPTTPMITRRPTTLVMPRHHMSSVRLSALPPLQPLVLQQRAMQTPRPRRYTQLLQPLTRRGRPLPQPTPSLGGTTTTSRDLRRDSSRRSERRLHKRPPHRPPWSMVHRGLLQLHSRHKASGTPCTILTSSSIHMWLSSLLLGNGYSKHQTAGIA